jgi:hypothetical protein
MADKPKEVPSKKKRGPGWVGDSQKATKKPLKPRDPKIVERN